MFLKSLAFYAIPCFLMSSYVDSNESFTKIENNVSIGQPILSIVVDEEDSLDHSVWNSLLQKNVSSTGKVNYKGFVSDKSKLNAYLKSLSENVPSSSASKNEKLAYYINVYNAFTVKLIVDNYPLESIMDIDKAWDKKIVELGGETYSLGQIENDILRKMGEPGIHFAINCASVSCPNILNKALTKDNVQSLMEKSAKSFINDKTKNDFSNPSNPKLSKIFEWYAEDFKNGDVLGYVNQYIAKPVSSRSKISYMEYDWGLNK